MSIEVVGSITKKTVALFLVLLAVAIVWLVSQVGTTKRISTNDGELLGAAYQGNFEKVKAMLESGCYVDTRDNTGATALLWAADQGHLKIVKLLIEGGADVNAGNDIGFTALMDAAGLGHLEIVKLLCEKGADVNAERVDGVNPLIAAVAGGGHLEVIKMLVEEGADLNVQVQGILSARRMAEINGLTDVAEYLKAQGAE